MRPTTPRRLGVSVHDGLELSVVEHGPGAQGPTPFVLVHGLASNARTWDGVAQVLATAGHRAWAVDLRGHGRSSRPDDGFDVPTVADDVCHLLATLSVEPVVLAGQSWGGNVVMEAAARCPARIGAVAGIDGGAIRLHDAYPDWDRCAAELAPPALEGMLAHDLEQRIRAAHPDWPESGIVGTMANFEVRGDGTIAPWLTRERHMRVLHGLWEHDPRGAFARIDAPSLLVVAGAGRHRLDEELRRRWVADAVERLPANDLLELPDADHDVHAQHPRLTAELLLALASRVRMADRGA